MALRTLMEVSVCDAGCTGISIRLVVVGVLYKLGLSVQVGNWVTVLGTLLETQTNTKFREPKAHVL